MSLTTTHLYLEDLTVGMTFTSPSFEMTEAGIIEFASNFDPQPFHTDPEAAKDTFFKGLSASGWHTAAVTMRLLTETLPIAGGLIGGRIEGLQWLQPVRPGDILRVVCTITSVRPSQTKPDAGWATVEHVTSNHNEAPVQRFTSMIRVPKRPTD